MRIVAIMPIKLNNERLPGKNVKELGGKPLLRYQLEELLKVKLIDDIYVYCSDTAICDYLPDGISFLQRDKELDLPTSNFNQIFESFFAQINADIYVYVHATAPFVTSETTTTCIDKVKSGAYDSAFTAVLIQDYLWMDGKPLNFDAENLPRSQDLKPIYRETSGVYVYTREQYLKTHRRVGNRPYIKMVSFKEAVDINNPEDFELAKIMCNI